MRDKALATFNSGLKHMVKSGATVQKRFLQDLKSVSKFVYICKAYPRSPRFNSHVTLFTAFYEEFYKLYSLF